MIPLPQLTAGDTTRCALALIVVGSTAAMMVMGTVPPNEWWVAVGTIIGFFFGFESKRTGA